MSLTAAAGAAPRVEVWSGDPFDLWDQPRLEQTAGAAFAVGLEDEQAPGAVWTVDLDDEGALDRRAWQLQSAQVGLQAAEARLDAFARRAQVDAAGSSYAAGISYAAGSSFAAGISYAAASPRPERELAAALAAYGPPAGRIGAPAGRITAPAASFGLTDGLDLDALRARFEGWMDTANRQLLHYVWVETRIAGRLAVRTAVSWGGDVSTYCQPAVSSAVAAAHHRSFGLAMTARTGTLSTVIAVARMALKISTLIATPLGAAQAVLLAWQFLQGVREFKL